MVANKSWADIVFNIGGVSLLEIQEMTYGMKQEVMDHYGPGNKPVSRGYGNITYDPPSLKMSFDELKRLEAAAPNGDITQYPPFTVSVIWKPTAQNPVGYTDTLTNFQFTSNGRDLKQGDTKHFATISGIYSGFNEPQ